ncbi:DMT family transporter [Noviherbaspirillum soli]|uniref:DMT family transporter n=1 Tax=Noviherbaspirillum soli TaxID=1064518 RepID=UPI00188A79A1|nr:DMT family transporter [Noviherbaspirillum soli]
MTMRTACLTIFAMLAFAANSLLCRLALKDGHIDAASFTALRIGSGALVLALIIRARGARPLAAGNWRSAWALFVYAAGFSTAYLGLSAATGALVLFGAVQATMIGYGLYAGERMTARQAAGVAIAAAGLAALLLPGLAAPSLPHALLMAAAGIAWGVYSLRAKGAGDPANATAGNFLRAAPMALALGLAWLPWSRIEGAGIVYALASGALASGLGYVIWYQALRGLNATTAASVQLCVPVLATLGGVLLLSEPLSWRLLYSAVAILGGLALVILGKARPRQG